MTNYYLKKSNLEEHTNLFGIIFMIFKVLRNGLSKNFYKNYSKIIYSRTILLINVCELILL